MGDPRCFIRCQAAKLTSVQEAVAGEAQPQDLPIHLQGIGHKCQENIFRRDYSKVIDLLLKYQDFFAKTKEDLGHTDLEQYRIKYRGCQTHKTTPRRMAFEKSSSHQGNWKNGEGWCHKKICKAMGITRSSSQKRQEIGHSVWTTDCWSIHATKTPIHYQNRWLFGHCLRIHPWSHQWALADGSLSRWPDKESLRHDAGFVSIQVHVIWPCQCPSHIWKAHGTSSSWTTMGVLPNLPGWYHELWGACVSTQFSPWQSSSSWKGKDEIIMYPIAY